MSNENTGIRLSRTKIDDDVGRLEKALSKNWIKRNKPDQSLNFGHGTLQDLYFERDDWGFRKIRNISDSEREVAATVIQWLGTNVGRSFLQDSFNDAGWEIQMRPKNKI